MQYARPSVDNLINNLPSVLKSSRQFILWRLEQGEKKVPLKPGGSSWGSYKNPSGWRTLNDAIDLLDRGKAFGIGLVLPLEQDAISLPDFNLITGFIAVDADAKRSPTVRPYDLPEHLTTALRFRVWPGVAFTFGESTSP